MTPYDAHSVTTLSGIPVFYFYFLFSFLLSCCLVVLFPFPRSQLGCSADFWKHTHQALGLHTTNHTSTSTPMSHHACTIALLKLSRNAVAHERVNQQLAMYV